MAGCWEWIDKAGYAVAVAWSQKSCVTAYVGNVPSTLPTFAWTSRSSLALRRIDVSSTRRHRRVGISVLWPIGQTMAISIENWPRCARTYTICRFSVGVTSAGPSSCGFPGCLMAMSWGFVSRSTAFLQDAYIDTTSCSGASVWVAASIQHSDALVRFLLVRCPLSFYLGHLWLSDLRCLRLSDNPAGLGLSFDSGYRLCGRSEPTLVGRRGRSGAAAASWSPR